MDFPLVGEPINQYEARLGDRFKEGGNGGDRELRTRREVGGGGVAGGGGGSRGGYDPEGNWADLLPRSASPLVSLGQIKSSRRRPAWTNQNMPVRLDRGSAGTPRELFRSGQGLNIS